MTKPVHLTGVERKFEDDAIIVSKTDLKGRITYANRHFLQISDYTEKEVLNQPHSLIRHPAMPRCVFKLLWDTISSGQEIFAYVINRTKPGDHYWVYAHVTPCFRDDGVITGYHSNRRVPDHRIIAEHIVPLYQALRDEEARHGNRKDGLTAAEKLVQSVFAEKQVAYDEFIATLGQGKQRGF